jgi:drug/metabolite transporter (DMT)-like permease
MNLPLIPLVSVIFAVFFWASSFVALKIAFTAYDPMVVIFGRMAIGFLCFIPFFKKLKGIKITKKDLKFIILMSICEPCLYFIFEARAIENTTASQAGMITALMPLMVGIAAYIFLKEDLSKKTWVGFVLSVTGAIWLSLVSSRSSYAPNPVLGNFLEFMAMLCATGYAISLKQLTRKFAPTLLTAFQTFVGAFFYFPFLFLPATIPPSGFEAVPAFAVIYLGACVTFGAYGLFNYGVSIIPVSQASAFINLIPVFTLILSCIILGERFTALQYVSSLLIFLGIFISQFQIMPPLQFSFAFKRSKP